MCVQCQMIQLKPSLSPVEKQKRVIIIQKQTNRPTQPRPNRTEEKPPHQSLMVTTTKRDTEDGRRDREIGRRHESSTLSVIVDRNAVECTKQISARWHVHPVIVPHRVG